MLEFILIRKLQFRHLLFKLQQTLTNRSTLEPRKTALISKVLYLLSDIKSIIRLLIINMLILIMKVISDF